MDSYAVIETGGKQYRVQKGTEIEVELLDIKEGTVLKFTDLLYGKTVTAKVLEHGKGEKLNIFKSGNSFYCFNLHLIG